MLNQQSNTLLKLAVSCHYMTTTHELLKHGLHLYMCATGVFYSPSAVNFSVCCLMSSISGITTNAVTTVSKYRKQWHKDCCLLSK